MPTKLILIRHGITEYNLKKRYSGFTDIGLSQKGKTQARKLHQRLKKEKIDKIYSSNRKRAINSSRIIFRGRKIRRLSDLRELHFGVFEGLTYGEIMKEYPRIYKKWLKDPFSICIPSGEDLNDFRKRVVMALKKILFQNLGKTVAIVSHGGVISIFINEILKVKKFWKFIPKPGSISIVEAKKGKLKVNLFNGTTHLL